MSKPYLSVSTGTARPYKPTVNQDAKDIADGVASQVRQAVHQTLVDAGSLRDAKTRRELSGKYPDAVLDGLAGEALAALARQAKESAGLSANSGTRAHRLTADVRNLPHGDFEQVPD
ncbi:hypothetical protein ACMSSJ_13810 [Kerstersia gyiorum]|uniref:hypothetical protein n=1 Tax=Kerstersia gyiorum TaxID=206506 RepID=UPI0039E8A704